MKYQRMVVTAYMCAGVLCLFLCPGSVAQNSSNAFTSQELHDLQGHFDPLIRFKRDLHQLPEAPDGSKGLDISFGGTNAVPASIAPFDSVGQYELHDLLCKTSAVVVAQEISESSSLSEGKNFIVTKYQFNVQHVLYAKSAISVGDTISVAQLGGTVTDDGETLSFSIRGASRFREGHKNLLFLRSVLTDAPDLYLVSSETIGVISGRVELEKGASSGPFLAGEPIGALKKRLTTALSKKACQ